MDKFIEGLLLCGNAFAENENFIKKYLSSNFLNKQNPKTDFFWKTQNKLNFQIKKFYDYIFSIPSLN